MNVFVLSTWSPCPVVNGSTQRIYHLLRRLGRVHAVDLVTFAAPSTPADRDVAEMREFCRRVTVVPRSPFSPVAGARSGWLSTTPDSLRRSDDPAVRELVRARAATADVAIGCQLSAARYLDPRAMPTVFEEAEPRQIQGQIADAGTPARRLRRRVTWWKHARYLARLVAPMRAVTVVSEEERDVLVAIGADPARVHVVPNGASAADLLRPRQVADPPRLIYPGAITYGPNFDAVRWFLADVLPRVRQARPAVDFWVTGDHDERLVQALPNARLARFTGRLPDVKAAIGDAAVTVVPLLTGGGTRLKVLESLALGTPVVSTRKGAEGLSIVDGREALLADDAATFAQRVLEVLSQPALAERLSVAGRRVVRERYTWDAIGDQFVHLVDDAAGGTSS